MALSGADPLNDVLQLLRVGGSLVLADTYPVPWSVEVPDAVRLAGLMDVAPDRVVAFHLVRRGRLEMTYADGTTVEAHRGDLLVCFGGGPHRLASGPGVAARPFEDLMSSMVEPDRQIAPDQPATTLLCGVFSFGRLDASPLADDLPAFVHIASGESDALDAISRLLAAEVGARRPGVEFAIQRILELVCAEALRTAADRTRADRPGWLRGLTDPAVLAAMSAIHQDPARDWDVPALGRAAAMSPSRLTARFRQALGRSPMAYAAEWRMSVAAHLLADTDLTVDQVARRVGYGSQPSFTRAFTRHRGISPRTYRERLAAPTAASIRAQHRVDGASPHRST